MDIRNIVIDCVIDCSKDTKYKETIDLLQDIPERTLFDVIIKLFKNKVKHILNYYNLHLYKVPGDGNCQFSSIAHQIYGDKDLSSITRKEIVDYIKENWDDYKNFIYIEKSKWLRRMGRDEWGDEITAMVAAKVYDKNVIIYNKKYNTCSIYTPRGEGKYGCPDSYDEDTDIFLVYNGEDHYNSVIPHVTWYEIK